jgi:DNA-binding protein YbaB
MFDSLKAAGALAGLMKNKEGLKAAGERIKARLTEIRAAGGSGGGAVRATVSGDMRVISVTLEPAALVGLNDLASRSMVESLIAEAVNNAMDIAKAMAQREISKEAQLLGLPEIPGLQSLLGG